MKTTKYLSEITTYYLRRNNCIQWIQE